MDSLDKRSITSKENGKKGGVKTVEGKAISSQNAVKHGIFAKYAVELDDTTFAEAYDYYAEEFGDDTPSRAMLISQLAILHIRLRRCVRFEKEYLTAKLNPPKYEQKLVREGMNLDFAPISDEYEEVMVDPGKPMKLELSELAGLENVYVKYEGQFLNRFCSIVDFLLRTAK
jgi:hypothetical protein